MNFGIEVKNLGWNWEAETGSVATMDLEKFPRSNLVAKNYEIYWEWTCGCKENFCFRIGPFRVP